MHCHSVDSSEYFHVFRYPLQRLECGQHLKIGPRALSRLKEAVFENVNYAQFVLDMQDEINKLFESVPVNQKGKLDKPRESTLKVKLELC